MRAKARGRQGGFVVSAELVIIATILVIGLIVGFVTIRDATTAEMDDVAEAFGSLDQSYSYQGVNTDPAGSWTSGANWLDTSDPLAGDGAQPDFNRAPSDGSEQDLDTEL